jgi:hypothetical protein
MMATSQLMVRLLLLTCFFLLSIQTSAAAGVTDKLERGQNLTDGETLVSAGGSYTLGFFSPGASSFSSSGPAAWRFPQWMACSCDDGEPAAMLPAVFVWHHAADAATR